MLWLAAFVLIGILRGPLRNAPTLLKKTLKFVIVSGFAVGLTILLTSDAAVQMSNIGTPHGRASRAGTIDIDHADECS